MYGIDEWVRRLQMSRRGIEDLLARGEIPQPVRFGRVRRWSDEQIETYIRERVEAVCGVDVPRGPGRPRAGA